MRTAALTLITATLLLAGCTGPTASGASSGADPTGGDPVDLVVIGDSIANPSGVCPGCTGFIDTFGGHIADTVGREVRTELLPRLTVPDAQATVLSEEGARALLADAEVIVVEVGYNNAMPDPATGIGCDYIQTPGIFAWISATTEECLDAGVETYGEIYDSILAELRELRGDEPTVFVLTNSTDGNIDPDDPTGLLSMLAPEEQVAGKVWIVEQYDRWNTMLAERADAAGFTLVDLYHAMNGPDGTTPFGDLSIDGAHPSQAGNDLIAATLAARVDLSSITPEED